MTLFILKRLAQIIPVTLGVTLVVFLIMQMIPGDPAIILAGEGASQETVNELRENLGLNKPLAIQYTDYIKNLLQGDMGHSLKNNQPVFEEITARLPITIELAFYSILITIVLGLIAGIISAIRPYSFMDVGLMIVALLGISLPSFWLGILLMYVFSVQLHWLPVAGWDSAKHIILPAVTLGAGGAAIVARMTRSSMLEVVNQDYIRTAKAKGLKGYIIILKHALRNALIPVITVVGLQFGSLLGGTVLVESVFAVNGLGRMIVDAIRTRDIPIVQGGVLVASLIFVFINLFVDILYRIFNKRMDLN
ncbi:ABC transporter permease [Lysinibacillus fusiformis]|jgi:peptide/nickel transport system permease protein|uniref:Nickel import system permease protein NikB n=1 Tax=Lysinibacillus fusiformis TaxID=28031 RepID=A0A1E4RAL7_9BACI|nr:MULTISPECIES: nickel ABC transporter permease [Lysinibacillus]EAZ85899.1 oligopeptide ABC transporter, permease [Bacillus sp. B14905]HAU34909.1 ABC transporter permease [Lysinibacillus sp.]AJK86739.1 peptide ABC transporter permease [Lysinibacillus fusiformis]KAB0443105.1 ABC transporter permease [Lysinibacillus fusiformis]KEK13113.1 peptide ABC transporter permease [Lysinibacillus sphaericus]